MTSVPESHDLAGSAREGAGGVATEERVGVRTSTPPVAPRRLRSLAPRFVRRRPVLRLTWQVAIFFVGVAILAAGAVMLVTPGPGWAAIIVGFAVLATEFVWAQRILASVKRYALRAKDRAMEPRTRRILLVSGVLVALLVGAGCTWYLVRFGLPW